MHEHLYDGVSIGIKGKVPVRLIGKCKKGDILGISNIEGVAIKMDENNLLIRLVALVDKDTDAEDLVLASLI